MSRRYAEGTDVPQSKSIQEIQTLVTRMGADAFFNGFDNSKGAAFVQFEYAGRWVRFVLPIPNREEKRFWTTPSRKLKRDKDAAHKEWEREVNRKWRELALLVKAKLVAVESGIVEFEREFASHILMPDGRTVGDMIVPQIGWMYETGEVPSGLPALPAPKEGGAS